MVAVVVTVVEVEVEVIKLAQRIRNLWSRENLDILVNFFLTSSVLFSTFQIYVFKGLIICYLSGFGRRVLERCTWGGAFFLVVVTARHSSHGGAG